MLRERFSGATVRHTRAHFSRTVLEGVAFPLRDAVYGAALTTAVAAGFFKFDVAGIEKMVPVEAQLEPEPATHERYCKLFDLYRRADRALAPIASGLRSFEARYAGGAE